MYREYTNINRAMYVIYYRIIFDPVRYTCRTITWYLLSKYTHNTFCLPLPRHHNY